MSEHIMGIEIGSSNIKIIEISKKATTLVVHNFSIISTPKNSISGGVIIDREVLRKIIGEELEKKKFRAKKVVSLVQSNNILIRNIIMDKQPEKIIKQILDLKTEEYLPVERNQYQIDFKILREFSEGEEEKIELVLVAAPNELIYPVVELIHSLKLVPKLITIPSEALGNVFGQNRTLIYDSIPDILVLDIGGQVSNVTIFADYKPVLNREISFGGDEINKILDTEMQKEVSLEKEDIFERIKPEIEYNIIAEIERILQFYYSSFGSKSIKKIYLMGGGASVEGLRTYIRDALNIPTEKITNFGSVVEAPDVDFEYYRQFFVNLLGAINGL